MSSTILSARELRVAYPVARRGGSFLSTRRRYAQALAGVSLEVAQAETIGVIGESGCGKSTLARAALRMQPIVAGSVSWFGRDVTSAEPVELRPLRRGMGVVWQDPYSSLDPRMTVEELVSEPLRVHESKRPALQVREHVFEMLEWVRLSASLAARFPHELSGGQCQRVSIARALVLRPQLLVCDEALSALDVSVQAQIIDLLAELKRTLQLAMLFISHDLPVARYLSDRIYVLYLGRVVEQGPRAILEGGASHPYTRLLLASTPRLRRAGMVAEAKRIEADPAAAPETSEGCPFRTRCPRVVQACGAGIPALREVRPGHLVACVNPETL